jgi:hypothetical protein
MRRRLEMVLRGVVLAALAVMLWTSVRVAGNPHGEIVSARAVRPRALVEWSRSPAAPERIDLQLNSVPSRTERAWLAALAGAGTIVSWRGDLTPVMTAVEPIAAPGGGAIVRVAAPDGSRVVVGDEIGALDSARIARSGATLVLGARSDSVSVSANGSVATAVRRDSVLLRKILVIGAAGWESKFTAAALEEEGWKVDVLVRVAPSVDVTSGGSATIDTSRYATVIALDATAAPYAARLTEFVRNGGGLILAPSAATTGALAPLRVTATDAIVLEKRGTTPTVSARRLGAGRVIQIAYEDTWRSRMSGADTAVAAHRRLWTNLVSHVAYAPRLARANGNPPGRAMLSSDFAPLADLAASIGPRATSNGMLVGERSPSSWTLLLFTILTLTLVGEIASRRLRGLR